MKLAYKLIFIFLFFVSLKALAQEPSLKKYDLNDGLPSNECYKVIQDKKGYIWIASDEGLSRYNGYTFQNFTKKEGLPDNVIIHLFEDKKGRIWAAGLNTRVVYFENESFHDVKELNHFFEENVKKASISSIYVNNDDELEIGFNVFCPHLLTYSLSKNKVTAYTKISPGTLSIKIENGSNFIFGHFNTQATYTNGVHTEIVKGTKKIISDNVNLKYRPNFFHYTEIDSNSFVMSIDKKLFAVTDNKSREVLTANTNILFIYKDKTNRIWVLAQNDGAYIFSPTDTNYSNPKHLFEGYSFSSVIQDQESNYWLSSLTNGVYQLPAFDIVHYRIKEHDKNIRMNAVAKYNNTLYAGGFSNYIYELNEQNELKKSFELFNKNVEIFDMANCSDKALVIAGLSSYLVNLKSQKITLSEIKGQEKLGGAYVRYIDAAKTGENLILAGTRIGAVGININNGLRTPFNLLPPSTLNSLYTDTLENRIYIACANGLYYTPDNFNSYAKINDSLLNTRINYISKTGDELILCSKERGLIFWNGKKARNIDASNGLASNECRKVVIDQKGNIWVSTNKGLSKIEKTANGKYEITNLTAHEGLSGDDINNFSVIENEIWIPNGNGLTKFSTNLTTANNYTIPVYITSIAVDDSLYKISSFSEIPYYHNYIKLCFNGLCFKNNENLMYEYRLTGLDTSWKKTKNIQVQFTKLGAGNYLFEVRALKNNRVQSISNAAFNFAIHPPWYKTWWFILLSFISIVVLIYLFFLFRFKRFKAREQEKTKLITLVTETEIKALRAQTNPHFIFNALNSIRLFILRNDSEQAQFYLMQFAQLMRDVLENSEHDTIYLSKEFSILKTYIELERLRFSKKFKFEISVPEEIENAKILIPPLLLQPIIENALWHGLMPLEDREGFLLLKVDKNINTVIITIEDNGIGRKKSEEIKIGKSNHKTSKGISITTNRIDLFNKKHKEQIKITTTDLEMGTRVELTIENI